MDCFKKPKKNKIKKPKKEPIDPAEDQLMEALNSSISIYETHIKTENSNDEQTQEASQDYDSYDDYKEEESKFAENNSSYSKKHRRKLNKTRTSLTTDDIEQTLASVQQQLEQQNKIMNNLLEVSTSMALLMDRYVKAEEKKTSILQKQFKSNEYQNLFLRRQEARKKFKCIKQQTD